MTEKTCDILDDMAQNGFIDSDISHKHIDHIMGIIWMIRMICQHMRQGAYDGETVIYGHAEVIALLRELSEKLIQKKDVAMKMVRQKKFWERRLPFSIFSLPRQNSLDFVWIWAQAES